MMNRNHRQSVNNMEVVNMIFTIYFYNLEIYFPFKKYAYIKLVYIKY